MGDTFTIEAWFGGFTAVTGDPVVTETGGSSRGGSWADYNGDGHLDLFVARDGINNRLYKNDGSGSFTLATGSGVETGGGKSRGGCWGDVNNDGAPDLFVANHSEGNWLYLNNNDPPSTTFTQVTEGDAVSGTGNSQSCAMVDYDSDGNLDLFVTNYDETNWLFNGNGDGTFTKVTSGAGLIITDADHSLGQAWGDIDGNGYLDLFVANKMDANSLYLNNGDGSFTKVTDGPVVASANYSNSGSFADFDNDGDLDLWVGTFADTAAVDRLYENQYDLDNGFVEVTSGAIGMDAGFSVDSAWADIDLDGDLDLFVVERFGNNRLYLNSGPNGFDKVTEGALVSDGDVVGQGAAFADIDGDGDLDLFVASYYDDTNFLYQNEGGTNSWITVELKGELSNRSAIGARVAALATIGDASVWQTREVEGKNSFYGQGSLDVELGLGDATVVNEIRIDWPMTGVQILTNVAVNQLLSVHEEGLVVTAPAAAATWSAGLTYPITWSSTAGIGDVQIEYSTDGGSSFTTIVASTVNDGSYDWLVPSTSSDTCLVRISDGTAGVEATSETFTIAGAGKGLAGSRRK
jgi:hypothetical protein